MNISTVNELIASLESAGELSIREQKFLKLAKEFRICSASLDAAIKTGNVLADQNSQLAAENVAMKQIIDSVTNLDNEPQYHDEGMGCGLEDRGITDRYDACRYGWDEAMERIYGEVIPCADELDFSATDAYLAGIKADGRAEGITRCACNQGNPVFKIDLNSDFIKHVKTVSEKVRAGNSPAQSDCCPAQSGNSPAIPDGYVMVPKEPTEAMMLHKSGCQHHAWDDPDCAMRQTRRLIWSHMLAAAPQLPGSEPATVPDRWIPVSERMPPPRYEVLVGRWWGEKPRWCCKWATYIPGHPDSQSSGWLIPGASWTPTHWMPLPAGPQEVR